ncbi:cysteine-rich with EGF-like domain protein 2 [Cloeon dipterum]|uniref:cysteine-rich with EGF-like domain protein 2 n=1 Tax=Cloeon dipterum TaxID=197152 RepID=UPI00322003F0
MCVKTITFISICALSLAVHSEAASKKDDEAARAAKLPPCESCKLYVTAFLKRVDATARSADGGLNLDEVHRRTCDGIGRSEKQCKDSALNHRSHVDQWWASDRQLDLSEWLCQDKLQVCCPRGHFGPSCSPCPEHHGGTGTCSGNGKCSGDGTRSGDGSCICDRGYKGVMCDTCIEGYYESFRDSKNLICSPCFIACKDTCSGAGPLGCRACKDGWESSDEFGCHDINECIEFTGACGANQFCVNTEGSYSCLDCDRSCDGCNGDGPDMCEKCAEGFKDAQGVCAEVNQQQQTEQATFTRYVTYAGLCVATFIIFNKNTLVAMVVGAAVSVYITVAEYMYGETNWDLGSLAKMLKNSE